MAPISKEDASKIQSTQATNGRDTSAGSFAARAQSAADRGANNGGNGGNASGQK